MIRPRLVVLAGVSLVSLTTLVGCYGTPFDKGDSPGSGTGTGRPSKSQVDQARTGGLGSPRGQEVIGPGALRPKSANPPSSDIK